VRDVKELGSGSFLPAHAHDPAQLCACGVAQLGELQAYMPSVFVGHASGPCNPSNGAYRIEFVLHIEVQQHESIHRKELWARDPQAAFAEIYRQRMTDMAWQLWDRFSPNGVIKRHPHELSSFVLKHWSHRVVGARWSRCLSTASYYQSSRLLSFAL
jgi:hypothetical protein